VHVVDLDAAMRQGSNRAIIAVLARRLNCQVGGGVRSAANATELLDMGAKRVVIGSALVSGGQIDVPFAESLSRDLGLEHLVFSVDAKKGMLAISGWKETVPISASETVKALDRYCSAFLYTNVDKEGGMEGFPISEAQALRAATGNQLMVGGGINSMKQIQELDRMGVDAVVGMAVYTGKLAI
jgi:phosphoribosylformimino-5-aminoimidazole carboxamide ribotide isomerase